jgi:hypothetical protein
MGGDLIPALPTWGLSSFTPTPASYRIYLYILAYQLRSLFRAPSIFAYGGVLVHSFDDKECYLVFHRGAHCISHISN